jgi:hypothetical protein
MSTRRAFHGRQPPRGQLLVLNRSFRRTLEAENKSPRTIQAYTDAVRLLATYCQAHRMPLLWELKSIMSSEEASLLAFHSVH